MSHHNHYDDHGDHDHHAGGHGGHAHDHSDDIEPALQKLLYSQIEFDKVITLNEAETGSGRGILQKTWAQRLDAEPVLRSDADEQLIVIVPFTGSVKLHSILVRTSSTDTSPLKVHIYANAPSLDFDSAPEAKPTQTIELSQTSEVQDIPIKRTSFNNVYSLTLFFADSYGADEVEMFYLGFKGEFMKLIREPVEVLYEAAANPSDHKLVAGLGDQAGRSVGHGQ